MNTVDAFQQQSEQVRHLLKQGDIAGAEKLLLELTETSEEREQPLVALLELYMQTQRPLEAISTLEKLVIEKPDSLLYLDRLAGMLSGFGQLGVAISHYQKFIRAHEDNANAWFNLALLYKRGKRFLDAIDAYEKSLSLGISDIHEVYSNMGVLYSDMRQADNARKMYEQAIEIQAQYLPALFNLAGLAEEEGQREEASAIYRDILKIDPDHHESMSRLAYLKKITAEDSAVLATGFPYRRGELKADNRANFDNLFYDIRGIRRMGSAAVDLAYVAAGRLDGFWELHLSPFDLAAGALLVREAGGVVTDADGGEDWLRGGHIVAANETLHAALRPRIEH